MIDFANLFLSNRLDYRKSLHYIKYYRDVVNSGLFDEKFYTETYSDVSGDPLTHYLVRGYLEGKLDA